jgi:oxygen-independent coproporphyrinogen-3 oxidase
LDSEILTQEQMRDESIMLAIRMRDGIDISNLTPTQLDRIESYRESGHISMVDKHLQLSPQGRLIADRIVRELVI